MPKTAADTVSRNALVILAVIAAGVVLYVLGGILTPLALALFLAVMMDGFARVLEKRLHVSGRAATILALGLSVLIFGGAAFFIADNAGSFATQLAEYGPRLNGLIARLAALVGIDVPPTLEELIQRLNPVSYLGQVARGLQSFVTTAAFVLIYLGFIIASRAGWQRKLIGLFPDKVARADALAVFLRIRNGVEQYLWVQTVTGLMIAVTAWMCMAAIHLDNALFWAILTFIVSYIPFLGNLISTILPSAFALVQFDTLWQGLGLFAVLQVIAAIIGNIIYPRMQGRSLNMDPIVLLLSLAFWSVVWGLAGSFLATPLTTMIMVIVAQFPSTRWIAVLLSSNGNISELKQQDPHATPDQKITAQPRPRRRTAS